MPPHVRGVINLRGTVIAVLDLRAKFSMAPVPAGERACIIVLQLGLTSTRPTCIGIIVDAVEEVVQLSNSEIEPCPDFGGSTASQYILGVATLQGCVKTLLEIEKIFAEEGEWEDAPASSFKKAFGRISWLTGRCSRSCQDC